jgi:RES domain-containing protein
MVVYRIAQSLARAQDLSGMGVAKYGGRWNSKGTYMLYTSANSSLAYLENLVHFDELNFPPHLYIAEIELKETGLIYELPDKKYPAGWQTLGNVENKFMGDKWMNEKQFIAVKVRSAINHLEFNFLLNPLFPGYRDQVVINYIEPIIVDARLIK